MVTVQDKHQPYMIMRSETVSITGMNPNVLQRQQPFTFDAFSVCLAIQLVIELPALA